MMMMAQLGPGNEDKVKNAMALSRAMMKMSKGMMEKDPSTIDP
jgi:hypothetical protein